MKSVTGFIRTDEGKFVQAPAGQVKFLLRTPAVQCDHGVPLLADADTNPGSGCFDCIFEHNIMRFEMSMNERAQ